MGPGPSRQPRFSCTRRNPRDPPRGAGPTPRAAPGGAFCSGRGAAGSQSGGTLAVLRPSLREGTELRPRGRGRGPPVSGVPLPAGPSRGAGVSLARLQPSREAELVAPARHRCPAMGRRWPALPHEPTAGFRQSPAGQGQRLHPRKTTSVLSSHQNILVPAGNASSCLGCLVMSLHHRNLRFWLVGAGAALPITATF